jgi:translation initiation factor IF-3
MAFACAKAFSLVRACSGVSDRWTASRLSIPAATMEEHISTEPRINERIRTPEVRLVGPGGEQIGIVPIAQALQMARDHDLDLVEVSGEARPPVTKLMDYGKYKYEAAQKARESRRNQANTVIKEMKLRPKIDDHDYDTKKGHVVRFLKGGDKVKITIMFRGREQSRPELGLSLLKKLAEDVAADGVIEQSPRQEGRNMHMVLAPTRKKSEARVDQAVAREAKAAQRMADAQAEKTFEAEHREQARSETQKVVKKKRGPADNMDPDIDL